MPNDIKIKVQTQFGAASDAYVTSTIHAQGESLKILTDLITPEPDWLMLDVATAAGHTTTANRQRTTVKATSNQVLFGGRWSVVGTHGLREKNRKRGF